jgi:hypothetical protein
VLSRREPWTGRGEILVEERAAARRPLLGEDDRLRFAPRVRDEAQLEEVVQHVPAVPFPDAHLVVEREVHQRERELAGAIAVVCHGDSMLCCPAR